MRVLIADAFENEGVEGLRAVGCQVDSRPGIGSDGLGEALGATGAEVLIVRSTKVNAGVISKARGLRLIVRAGAGVDNIDIPAASAARVAVCNCPGMNAAAVAELAMGLLLACDRRIVEQTLSLRDGRWDKKEFAKARGLKGRRLGVVGLGAIGAEVVRRARAFDMRVDVWSRSLTPAKAAEIDADFAGTTRAQLLAMAPRCDAVSIHVGLSDETKGLCGREFFAAMRPGAIFVNTSRGGVVDAGALADAIRTKGLRAGLDVFSQQPPTPQGEFTDPVVKLPGVVGTHHCGASTDQAQAAVASEAVRIIEVFKRTGRAENCVNAAEVAPAVRTSPAGGRVTR